MFFGGVYESHSNNCHCHLAGGMANWGDRVVRMQEWKKNGMVPPLQPLLTCSPFPASSPPSCSPTTFNRAQTCPAVPGQPLAQVSGRPQVFSPSAPLCLVAVPTPRSCRCSQAPACERPLTAADLHERLLALGLPGGLGRGPEWDAGAFV